MAFRLLVDVDAQGRSRGVDVDEDANDVLRDGRRYRLVREHDSVRDRRETRVAAQPPLELLDALLTAGLPPPQHPRPRHAAPHLAPHNRKIPCSHNEF